MDRRTFNATLAGSVALTLARTAKAASMRQRVALYTAVGPRLLQYDLDAQAATVVFRNAVNLPSAVQYAWPHPSGRFLYATCSDSPGGSRTITGTRHRLIAFRIGSDASLSQHG